MAKGGGKEKGGRCRKNREGEGTAKSAKSCHTVLTIAMEG